MSQMPSNAKKPLSGLEGLRQIGENLKQRQQEQQQLEQPEDLNILPMPTSQKIGSDHIEWSWDHEDYDVIAFLWTKNDPETGYRRGDFVVRLKTWKEEPFYDLAPQVAKEIGQNLVSAANWINIWKLHAGTFLERELLGVVDGV
jgi:hypothetical protein